MFNFFSIFIFIFLNFFFSHSFQNPTFNFHHVRPHRRNGRIRPRRRRQRGVAGHPGAVRGDRIGPTHRATIPPHHAFCAQSRRIRQLATAARRRQRRPHRGAGEGAAADRGGNQEGEEGGGEEGEEGGAEEGELARPHRGARPPSPLRRPEEGHGLELPHREVGGLHLRGGIV